MPGFFPVVVDGDHEELVVQAAVGPCPEFGFRTCPNDFACAVVAVFVIDDNAVGKRGVVPQKERHHRGFVPANGVDPKAHWGVCP